MSLISTFTNASINGWRNPTTDNGYIQQTVIIPSIIGANYNFGFTCAISGDGNYCAISNSGVIDLAVYIFKNNNDGTWTEETRIPLTTVWPNDLALNYAGDYLVVGKTGLIEIYTRSGTTWSLQQNITGTADFGRVCDIDSNGTRIVTSDTSTSSNRGTIYVYSRAGTTWTLESSLVGSGGAAGDANGIAVAINDNGDYIISGAPRYGVTDVGAVYVYIRSGTSWSEQTRITGYTISQSGESARIMAINEDGSCLIFSATSGNPANPNYVHIYNRSGTSWSLTQTLTHISIFGWALAINAIGDIIVINAIADNSYTGILYVYKNINGLWTQIQTLNSNPSQTSANFTERHALDIDNLGTFIIGGASSMDTYATNSGSAFIFSNE